MLHLRVWPTMCQGRGIQSYRSADGQNNGRRVPKFLLELPHYTTLFSMLILDQFAKHFETLLLSENAPFQHSFKMKKKNCCSHPSLPFPGSNTPAAGRLAWRLSVSCA